MNPIHSLDSVLSVSDVQMQGYLLKQGDLVKSSWRERYFVVQGDRLTYFMDKQHFIEAKESRGYYALRGASIAAIRSAGNVVDGSATMTKRFCFSIKPAEGFKTKPVVLAAPAEADRRQWLAALRPRGATQFASSVSPFKASARPSARNHQRSVSNTNAFGSGARAARAPPPKPQHPSMGLAPLAAPTSADARTLVAEDRDAEWFYETTDNEQHGPISVDELKEQFAAGAITEKCCVWRDGLEDWTELHALEALLAFLTPKKQKKKKKRNKRGPPPVPASLMRRKETMRKRIQSKYTTLARSGTLSGRETAPVGKPRRAPPTIPARFGLRAAKGKLTFVSVFPNSWEMPVRQAQQGNASLTRIASYLKKCVAADRDYHKKMVSINAEYGVEAMQVHRADQLQSYLMWADAYGLFQQGAAQHKDFADRIVSDVLDPINDLLREQKASLARVVEQHRVILKALNLARSVVKSDYEECRKLLYATKIAQMREEEHKKHKKARQKGNKYRVEYLKGTIRKKMNKLVKQTPSELISRGTRAAQKYEADIKTVNILQTELTKKHEPALFKELERIETQRLHVLKTVFSALAQRYADAHDPVSQQLQQLIATVKRFDVQDKVKIYLNSSFKRLGPPNPPPAYEYELSVRPAQIMKGIVDPTPDSLFNSTLQHCMEMQAEQHPEKKVPLIVEVLIDAVWQANGYQTEGIFRISAKKEELDALEKKFDAGDMTVSPSAGPHLPASLLKYWLRSLTEPLIPEELYQRCVDIGRRGAEASLADAVPIFDALDPVNCSVVQLVSWMCQDISAPENAVHNRMSLQNLAIVFAPGMLRNPSDDPMAIMASVKFETRFVELLLGCVARE